MKQGDLIGWAIRGLYQAIDEKIPKEFKERLDKVKDMSEKDLTNLLADVRERLGHREDLDNHKDIDATLQQMLRHLDPYTTYIDPETIEQFKQETDATFTGIGIQIRKDVERDMLKVVTPIKDSPAYKAGVKTGDVITQIKREMDSKGKKLETLRLSHQRPRAERSRSENQREPKTKVRITVEREGERAEGVRDYPRQRRRRNGHGRQARGDDTWDFMIDPQDKIAYIRLTSFAQNTAKDLFEVISRLNNKKIQRRSRD